MNKIALVTGATAGIGKAVALKLADLNFNLIITGRREERLTQLSKSIQEKHDVQVLSLCFDVRQRETVKEQLENLPAEWKNIDVLVNNAGLAAGLSSIQEGSIDDWEQMIDTNIKGLLFVTRSVSPWMIERQSGHIINIGSIAGKEVYPNGGVYCSTKHAIDALTKGMRMDMVQHKIKVTAINPGMVETEFSIVRFKGDTERAEAVYEGLIPLYAEDIAEAVAFAVSRPPHVNIDDMLIMPTAQASATIARRE